MREDEVSRIANPGTADEASFLAGGVAFQSQSAAMVVVEARAFSQLLFEHANFLFELFNADLRVVVHPSGKADEEQGRGFRP